jgi:hypothetical protein
MYASSVFSENFFAGSGVATFSFDLDKVVVRFSTPGSFWGDFCFGGKAAADLSFGGMVLSMALFSSSSLSSLSSASSPLFLSVSFSSSSLSSLSLASSSSSEFASSVVSRIVSYTRQ